jgi:hypothetical protein
VTDNTGETSEAPVPPSESVPAAAEPAPLTSGEQPARIVPIRPIQGGESKRYTMRFAVIYTVLGLVFAAAVIGFVALIVRPAAVSDPAWSTWKPKSGSVSSMTKQIADHVASKYRLSEDGSQLVAVIQSPPRITSGPTDVKVTAIAIRKAPQTNAGIRILEDTSKTRLYTLCGLGKSCAIEGGTPSVTRLRLLRREALETALYTFKFVPAVEQIVTFMPPAPGDTTSSVLFLEKTALKDRLKQPLTDTLPLKTPPLPDAENLAEAATIDKLTAKNMFSYELTALPTGGAGLILDPAS